MVSLGRCYSLLFSPPVPSQNESGSSAVACISVPNSDSSIILRRDSVLQINASLGPGTFLKENISDAGLFDIKCIEQTQCELDEMSQCAQLVLSPLPEVSGRRGSFRIQFMPTDPLQSTVTIAVNFSECYVFRVLATKYLQPFVCIRTLV